MRVARADGVGMAVHEFFHPSRANCLPVLPE